MSISFKPDYSQIEKRVAGTLFTHFLHPMIVAPEGMSVTGRLPREPFFAGTAASKPAEVSHEVQLAIMAAVLGKDSQAFAARAALKQERFNLMYGSRSEDTFGRFAQYNVADLIEYPLFDSKKTLRTAIAKILH